MKKTILLTAVSFLAIQTAYAVPFEREQDGRITLRRTGVTEEHADKETSYSRQGQKPSVFLDARTASLEIPYVSLRKLLQPNGTLSTDDITKTLAAYRAGELLLSWSHGGLTYQQYCIHPGLHTLAVRSGEGDIYYRQQRYMGELGNSPLGDVFSDTKHRLEYWFDLKTGQWVVEGRKQPLKFSNRAAAIKAMGRLAKKYDAQDTKDGITPDSFSPLYSFADPLTRKKMDAEEDTRYASERPSRWTTGFMGWLALTSGMAPAFNAWAQTSAKPMPIDTEDNPLPNPSVSSQSLTLGDMLSNVSPYHFAVPLLMSFLSSRDGRASSLSFMTALTTSFGTAYAQAHAAAIPPMQPAFQISNSTSDQRPGLAKLETGNIAVTWVGSESSYGCVIEPTGRPVADPFIIANGGTETVVTSLPGGNFMAAWDATPPSAFGELLGRVYNATGYPEGSSFPISSEPIQRVHTVLTVPSLSSSEKTVVATWGGGRLFGQILSLSGERLGDEFELVNDDFSNIYTQYGAVTQMTDGNMLFAYSTNQDSPHEGNIFGMTLNNMGDPITRTRQINFETTEFFLNPPMVASLPNSNVVAVWTQSGRYIFGRILDNIGAPVSQDFVINQNALNDGEQLASVAVLPSGDLIFAWDSPSGVYSRIFTDMGVALTPEFCVNTGYGELPGSVAVTALPDGNAIVAWSTPKGIMGRSINASALTQHRG